MYEIIPNLYLSSYHSVIITSNTFIINCTKNLDMLNDNNIRIPIDDDGSEEAINGLLEVLPNIVEIIDNKLKENKIVTVHCLAGQQRSPAVIAAYLIAKKGYNMDDAIEYIRSIKRDAFFWKINFKKSLEKFIEIIHK